MRGFWTLCAAGVKVSQAKPSSVENLFCSSLTILLHYFRPLVSLILSSTQLRLAVPVAMHRLSTVRSQPSRPRPHATSVAQSCESASPLHRGHDCNAIHVLSCDTDLVPILSSGTSSCARHVWRKSPSSPFPAESHTELDRRPSMPASFARLIVTTTLYTTLEP